MIDITGYVLLRALEEKGMVNKRSLRSFLVRTLPIEANLVANASPVEIDNEVRSVVEIINNKVGDRCINIQDDVVFINRDNDRCIKKVEEIIERYEKLVELANISLLGRYISIIKPHVDMYVKTLRDRGIIRSSLTA